MTYSKVLEVKAELVTFLSVYIKISLKAHLKEPLQNTFTVYSFIFMNVHWMEAQVLDPGGMTHHLEIEVTWEQHKTPWRSGLSFDEKESPWKQMDLMLPKVLSLEGTFTHLHER